MNRRSTYVPTHTAWGFVLVSAFAGGIAGTIIGAGIIALLLWGRSN